MKMEIVGSWNSVPKKLQQRYHSLELQMIWKFTENYFGINKKILEEESPGGAPQVQGRAPRAGGCLVGPLMMILSPIIFICSKVILCNFLGHLVLYRIGISDIALSGPEFQLLAISLFMWNLQNKREKA